MSYEFFSAVMTLALTVLGVLATIAIVAGGTLALWISIRSWW